MEEAFLSCSHTAVLHGDTSVLTGGAKSAEIPVPSNVSMASTWGQSVVSEV